MENIRGLKNYEEKRIFERFECDLNAIVKTSFKKTVEEILIKNIAPGGLNFISSSYYPLNETLEIYLTPYNIYYTGKVVWTKKKESFWLGGLKFDEINLFAFQRILEKFKLA